MKKGREAQNDNRLTYIIQDYHILVPNTLGIKSGKRREGKNRGQGKKERKREFILLLSILQLPLTYFSKKVLTVVKKEKCYFHLFYLHF